MRTNLGSAAIALAIAAGCAPPIDGPIDHQRAIDRDDGDRLAAQLAQLPGVVSASVVLHHAMRDPLAVTPPGPATFSAVIATDDAAEPDAIRAAATRLAHAALPELPGAAALPIDERSEIAGGGDPDGFAGGAGVLPRGIEIHAVVHRPVLAQVGPFWVEQSSRAPLKTALALGCLTIAGLAGSLVVYVRGARGAREARGHRRGNSAQ